MLSAKPYWSDRGQTVTELSKKSVVRINLNPLGSHGLLKKNPTKIFKKNCIMSWLGFI